MVQHCWLMPLGTTKFFTIPTFDVNVFSQGLLQKSFTLLYTLGTCWISFKFVWTKLSSSTLISNSYLFLPREFWYNSKTTWYGVSSENSNVLVCVQYLKMNFPWEPCRMMENFMMLSLSSLPFWVRWNILIGASLSYAGILKRVMSNSNFQVSPKSWTLTKWFW